MGRVRRRFDAKFKEAICLKILSGVRIQDLEKKDGES